MTLLLLHLHKNVSPLYGSSQLNCGHWEDLHMLNEDYKEMLQILLNNKVKFLSKENLIKNKEATGREKDRLDAKYLKNSKNV